MSDKIGLFTGSFDPVTLGHLDIIIRASHLVDQLYVGIFYNKDKAGLFSVESRQSMLEASLADYPKIKVITARDSLAVDIAKQLGVTHLVRGLRNATDFEYEANLAYYNHHLVADLETVFLLTADQYRHVSSSRIRELIHFEADIAAFVPQAVVTEVEKQFGHQQRI
ncbi:pantetheine-phosphate adenylyltransferase [Streptococcus caprae]|uniref:Phosphopantetheine adenylyltransferase n=1 Tax=Streptococcus caprae TaxID=1640501 RepID=A0ABV8CX06_9STRE